MKKAGLFLCSRVPRSRRIVRMAMVRKKSSMTGLPRITRKLKEKIKDGQIDTLVYSDADFTYPLKDVIETAGNEAQLVGLYGTLSKDQVYLKHTLLIALICKAKNNAFKDDVRQKAKDILVSALKDDHFWIRTEAVAGLRFFGDTSTTILRRITPLTTDKSTVVRKEAVSTLVELYEQQQDRTDKSFRNWTIWKAVLHHDSF